MEKYSLGGVFMNTIKVKAKETLLVAHRGLSGLEMENTCAAFVAAGNRSYFLGKFMLS